MITEQPTSTRHIDDAKAAETEESHDRPVSRSAQSDKKERFEQLVAEAVALHPDLDPRPISIYGSLVMNFCLIPDKELLLSFVDALVKLTDRHTARQILDEGWDVPVASVDEVGVPAGTTMEEVAVRLGVRLPVGDESTKAERDASIGREVTRAWFLREGYVYNKSFDDGDVERVGRAIVAMVGRELQPLPSALRVRPREAA
jgi:hypothetical protein